MKLRTLLICCTKIISASIVHRDLKYLPSIPLLFRLLIGKFIHVIVIRVRLRHRLIILGVYFYSFRILDLLIRCNRYFLNCIPKPICSLLEIRSLETLVTPNAAQIFDLNRKCLIASEVFQAHQGFFWVKGLPLWIGVLIEFKEDFRVSWIVKQQW
jgi:hypothetical protein